jgi:predicted MFS family arabinose efflux permease
MKKMLKTWLPVLASMCCFALGPGLMSIYGFFVEPLSLEFGVGIAVLNLGPVALLLVPAILGAQVGKLADRLPVRRILLVGATVSMVSLIAIGHAPAMWLVAVGFLCFSVGLTLYGPVVINGLMVKQFPGREARALAVAAIGISLASAVLPPLVGALLEHYDWRVTLQGLAVGLMGILWLVILAGIPAGVVGPVAGGEAPVAARFYGNKAFWLIGLCVAMGLNVSIVLAVCYPPLFVSRGYSVADAGWFLAFAGTAGLVGKSCLAGFGDAIRHYAKWLAAALLLIQIAGLGLLFNAEEDSQIILALSVMGFGSGAFIPMHPYLNSRYFDAAIISQVNGAQMPLFLPFALIGAPLAGFAYDQMGNYDAVLIALALTLGAAALLVLLLPQQKD